LTKFDRTLVIALGLALLALAPAMSAGAPVVLASFQDSGVAVDPAVLALGEEVYLDQCLMCHGSKGRGDGPAARFEDPPPRDLTAGEWVYAVDRTVASIERVLHEGIDDTGMLSFSETLTDEEVHAVAWWVHEAIVLRQE